MFRVRKPAAGEKILGEPLRPRLHRRTGRSTSVRVGTPGGRRRAGEERTRNDSVQTLLLFQSGEAGIKGGLQRARQIT